MEDVGRRLDMLQCHFAHIRDLPQRFEQDSATNRFRLGRQLGGRKGHALGVGRGEIPVPAVRQGVQPGPVLPGQAGRARD